MKSVELPFLFDVEKEVSRRGQHTHFFQALLGFTGVLDSNHFVWGGTRDCPKVIPCCTYDGPSHCRLDECTMVVRPSWVTTEEPSIFSCHTNGFCCGFTHPISFSPFGQGWLRMSSLSRIFVFEEVILGGCLTIKGRGFGSHVESSVGSVFRTISSTCCFLGCPIPFPTCKSPTLFPGSTTCLNILLLVRLPVYRAARTLHRTWDMNLHIRYHLLLFKQWFVPHTVVTTPFSNLSNPSSFSKRCS